MLSRFDACTIAYAWASVTSANDEGCWLYAFASTGRVLSELHRKEALAYIDTQCRERADEYMADLSEEDEEEGRDDHAELDELRKYIATAPIEIHLTINEEK